MPVIYPDKEKTKLPDGRVRHWLADRSKGTTAGSLLENVIAPGGGVPPHSHDVEELIICIDGEGEWTIDGRKWEFYPGCVAHIPAGKIHSLRNTGNSPLHQFGFLAHPEPPAVTHWIGNEY